MTKEEEQLKENPSDTPPSIEEPVAPTNKPLDIQLRPPIIEQQSDPDHLSHSTDRYSATTLPLPNRPSSSYSDTNEGIYDQLPATLPKRPKQAVTNVPPPVSHTIIPSVHECRHAMCMVH